MVKSLKGGVRKKMPIRLFEFVSLHLGRCAIDSMGRANAIYMFPGCWTPCVLSDIHPRIMRIWVFLCERYEGFVGKREIITLLRKKFEEVSFPINHFHT